MPPGPGISWVPCTDATAGAAGGKCAEGRRDPSVQQSADTSGFADPAEGSADITVTKVEAATREPVNYGNKSERGWFVIVHGKAVGTGGGLDVNPVRLLREEPQRLQDRGRDVGGLLGPGAGVDDLNDGEHISGTMVYDVPSRHGQIVYAPNLDGEPIGI